MATTIFPGVKGGDIILDAPGTDELLSKEAENVNSGKSRRKVQETTKINRKMDKPSNAAKTYTSIPKAHSDSTGDIYEI